MTDLINEISGAYEVQEWDDSVAINVGAETFIPYAVASGLGGLTNVVQVRLAHDSESYLYNLDDVPNGFVSTESDSLLLGGATKVFLTWDARYNGVLYRVRQGYVDVNPIGTVLTLAPTLVSFADILGASARANALVSEAISDFTGEFGDLSQAVSETEADRVEVAANVSLIQNQVSSLNNAASFAVSEYGTQGSKVYSGSDVRGITFMTHSKMSDGGASMIAKGVPEQFAILTTTALRIYRKDDNTLLHTIASADSGDVGRSFFPTGLGVNDRLEFLNGWLFFGLAGTVGSAGVRAINIFTGVWYLLGANGRAYKGLRTGVSDATQDMPIEWGLNGTMSGESIHDISLYIDPSTEVNPDTGVKDPTVTVGHNSGWTVIQPNRTLDTGKITSRLAGNLYGVLSNDRFMIGLYSQRFVTYAMAGDSVSLLGSAMYTSADGGQNLHPQTTTHWRGSVISNDIITVPTTKGLMQAKLGTRINNTLGRFRDHIVDTQWAPRAAVSLAESTADLAPLDVGNTLKNHGYGPDFSIEGPVTRTQCANSQKANLATGAENVVIDNFDWESADFYFTCRQTSASTNKILMSFSPENNAGPGLGLGDGPFMVLYRLSTGSGFRIATRTAAGQVWNRNSFTPSIEAGTDFRADLYVRDKVATLFINSEIVLTVDYSTSSILDELVTATSNKLRVAGAYGNGVPSNGGSGEAITSDFKLCFDAELLPEDIKWMYEVNEPSFILDNKTLLNIPTYSGVNPTPQDSTIDMGRLVICTIEDGHTDTIQAQDLETGVVIEGVTPKNSVPELQNNSVTRIDAENGNFLAMHHNSGVVHIKRGVNARELRKSLDLRPTSSSDVAVKRVATTDGLTPIPIWSTPIQTLQPTKRINLMLHAVDLQGQPVAYYNYSVNVTANPILSVQNIGFSNLQGGGTGLPQNSLGGGLFTLSVVGLVGTVLNWKLKVEVEHV